MAAKKDPAAELAGKMLHVLEAQRRLGDDSYPLTLRRLGELTDPAAPTELVLKAAGKKKPFGEQAVAVQPKNLDSPVALAEDADRLAGSTLLLEFVLGLVCTPASPTCDPGKLKSKLPVKLRPAFETALQRRLAENDLPPGVAVVPVKKKQHLHLVRYALPRPPELVLAENLVQLLRGRRQQGESAYPLTLSALLDMSEPAADARLVKKALTQPVFQETVLLAIKNRPETPAALAEDRDLLAGSTLLLETTLRLTRSETSQVCTPADLKKKVIPALQKPLLDALSHRLESRTLPPTIGCLLQKKKPLLFLLSDVGQAFQPDAPQSQAGKPDLPADLGDFPAAFDEAFARLDRQHGGHNFVSLVELRRALPLERARFDAELENLRRSGRYTLSAAEGRHGITPEEREAGIYEDGSLLLYVSRKLS